MKKKEKIRQRRQREKEGGARKERINRHAKKSSLIMAAVFFVFAISVLVWQVSIVSFDEAVRNPELRERFVQKIIKKLGEPPNVIFAYINTPEEMEILKKEWRYLPSPNDLMVFHIGEMDLERFGKNFPTRVSVFPRAFDGGVIETEDDFASALFHELRHIENIRDGKLGPIEVSLLVMKNGELNQKLGHDVDEMGAYGAELTSQVKISGGYRLRVMRRYLDYYYNLWDDGKDMEPEFIEELKVKFFESWMWSRPEMKAEIITGRKNWYLEHPATKRKYYLPKNLFPGN